jgi:transposase, IS30 family
MRHYKHLTQEQRYQIDALLKEKVSQTRIAQIVGVHKSTISREVRNNRGACGYFAAQAHRMAIDQRRDKAPRRIQKPTWDLIEEKLRTDQWSPQQIAGWLAAQGLPRVSHERIYQYVRRDKAEGGDLHKHLRARRPYRRRGLPARQGAIVGRTSIEERPAVVERRERIGDWEADTIIGRPGRAVVVSLVERTTRLTLLARAACKSAAQVARAIRGLLERLADRVHTVTCDNGSEFAHHASLADSLEAQFFFAHPYSSWERGLNENTNGLVRQYFPKRTDFSLVTDKEIEVVMNKLNERPRKALGYRTPNQAFFEINPTVALRG